MALLVEPSARPDKPEPHAWSAPPPTEDQRVILNGMTWKDYEILLAVRGDESGVRMAYLNGAIELMSPSINHEGVKKTIARLVEAYADERAIGLNGYGSWTLKNAFAEKGLEPDECYALGVPSGGIPQLAIEVVWTSGGLNKLEIYRSLGVGEVWIWERGVGITVHLLKEGRYEKAPRSAVLPDLDLALLQSFVESPDQSQAVRAFRQALRTS
ncbi:Uma2 family endonuclease [Polyangium sorediatum]|uniref:Uma2 family endonuclease n=1 Tax=Polyangium sorediatum TaxID=889274 RepID=A0ABT6P9K1_9BACT|nr:Uma2 family endonuclease [Polyangium sorediatum]MDI1437208.1 Uma2 family endonuclease [Polyangium sorediatum]